MFCLQGHPGTGKTNLINKLRDNVRSKGLLVEVTATTGIPATLYYGGRTLHSLFGIGADDEEENSNSVHVSKKGSPNQSGPHSSVAYL